MALNFAFGINPVINIAIFPNTPLPEFWSASPRAAPSRGFYEDAWTLSFEKGTLVANITTRNFYYVRLVRSTDSFP